MILSLFALSGPPLQDLQRLADRARHAGILQHRADAVVVMAQRAVHAPCPRLGRSRPRKAKGRLGRRGHGGRVAQQRLVGGEVPQLSTAVAFRLQHLRQPGQQRQAGVDLVAPLQGCGDLTGAAMGVQMHAAIARVIQHRPPERQQHADARVLEIDQRSVAIFRRDHRAGLVMELGQAGRQIHIGAQRAPVVPPRSQGGQDRVVQPKHWQRFEIARGIRFTCRHRRRRPTTAQPIQHSRQ